MKKRIVLIPEKLSVNLDSKIKGIHYFHLGECLTDNIFEHEREKFNIELNIVSNSSNVFKINNPIHLTKDYKITEKSLYFRKKHHFFDFRILIENIDSNDIELFVNKQYWKLVKFKIENLYPVGIHLTDLLLLKAIENNDLIIYGASLFNRKTDSAFLIMSLPAVGKTHTTFKLLHNKDYQYLGEDVSYYDSQNNELYCVPFSSSWSHHRNRFYFFSEHNNVINIFGKDKVKEKTKLKRIYLPEYAKENKITKIPNDARLLNKILNLQRNAFSYYKNPLFRTVDYFRGNLDIENLYKKEALLFEQMLKDKDVYLVSSDNYDNFHQIIHKNEANQ